MSRRTGRSQSRNQLRVPLQVERLEDRNLLDASGTTALVAPAAWTAVVPNDPNFSSQYAFHNTGQTGGKAGADISAEAAWNVSTGSMKTVVGVIDTGIDYNHIDLYQNIWINQGEIPSAIRARLIDTDGDGLITFRDLNDSRNIGSGKIIDVNKDGRIDGSDLLASVSQGGWADGIDNDHEGHVDDIIGWNFANNTNNPFDDNGHGTHVSGIIGAMGNNGTGVVGVDWNVQLMGLKFLDSNGFGSVADAIPAFDYAIAHGAFATNNSWAMGNAYWQPLYDAMNRAQQAGMVTVVAAGNGDTNGNGINNDSTPTYPSSFNLSSIIAVAASTANDTLTSYSNYGATTVDLAAPGSGILSTYPNNRYETLGGTSMATPYVTGAVALVHSIHPTWTAAQVIQQIESSVDKLPALSGKTVTGGRLDLAKAVGASSSDISGPQISSLTPNGPSNGPISSVRVTFNEAIDPSTFGTDDVVSFTGPNGSIQATGVQAVAGSGNKQFDVSFAKQSAPGNYKLILGPNIKDTAGNSMDQNRNGVNGESTADRYTGTFAISSVSSWTTGGVRINEGTKTIVSQNVSSDITIGSMNVFVTLTYPNLSNLTIQVKGPDGTTVTLFDQHGGANLQSTVFDDSASTPIGNGSAPYTGSFRPESALSVFNGKDARGTWQLIITNRSATTWGRDNLFTLNFQSAPASGSSASVAESTGAAAVTDAAPAPLTKVQAADIGEVVNSLVIDGRHHPEVVTNAVRTFDVTPARKQESSAGGEANRLRDMALSQLGHTSRESEAADVTLDRLMTFFESLKR